MDDLFEHVGKKIRALRDAYDGGRGLSQEKLADAMGVTTNTISRWETATYRPDLAELDKLAKFFRVSILTFLPEKKTAEPADEALSGLIETARDLEPEDVEEVRRFAEFRRSTRMQRSPERPRRGRRSGR
jgi:transcriptional regulator with XRE-family HTH domain